MTAEADFHEAELQRRMAGNTQLLQAIIGIRLRSVADPESRRHLTWLSDIVAALGLLNRRSTRDGDVDFGAYLQDAAAFWRRGCDGRPIRIEVRGAVSIMPDSHVTPLAIILHELMSNALRHAFPGDAGGVVAVAVSQASDGVSLVVRDTGVGCDISRLGEGLGLIEGLADHLGGSVAFETAPDAGFAARVRLPLIPRSRH
jgi:two-component sensor histidine kinase